MTVSELIKKLKELADGADLEVRYLGPALDNSYELEEVELRTNETTGVDYIYLW